MILLLLPTLLLIMSGCTFGGSRVESSRWETISFKKMGEDAGRGIVNVSFCWMEVPHKVKERVKKEPVHGPFNVVGGTLRGAFGALSGSIYGARRGVGGVFEFALSPFPPYGPLMYPAYPPYLAGEKGEKEKISGCHKKSLDPDRICN